MKIARHDVPVMAEYTVLGLLDDEIFMVVSVGDEKPEDWAVVDPEGITTTLEITGENDTLVGLIVGQPKSTKYYEIN